MLTSCEDRKVEVSKRSDRYQKVNETRTVAFTPSSININIMPLINNVPRSHFIFWLPVDAALHSLTSVPSDHLLSDILANTCPVSEYTEHRGLPELEGNQRLLPTAAWQTSTAIYTAVLIRSAHPHSSGISYVTVIIQSHWLVSCLCLIMFLE